MHWATPYIGKPWALGAVGPNSYDCWGLTCAVQLERAGREMPPLSIGSAQNAEQLQGLYELVKRSSWRQMPDGTPLAELDILTMRGHQGSHVGVVIEVDGAMRLLHAVGSLESPGSIIHSSIAEVRALGWSRLQIWRHIEAVA